MRTADQARQFLNSIDVSDVAGLRDRALIGPMVYSFAGVSAAVGMKVEDYFPSGKRWWCRLHEKGGKRHEVPAHHNAETYIDAYLKMGGIEDDRKGPHFRTVGRNREVTRRRMHQPDVLRMIDRRAKTAGLDAHVSATRCARPTSRRASTTAGQSRRHFRPPPAAGSD